jgi:hypothetical protein
MKWPSRKPVLLAIFALASVVFLSLGVVSAVQVTQITPTPTFTVSTTTSLLITTPMTVTTTSTHYTNITNIFKSTSTEGTQTATVYFTTTTTINSATTAYTGKPTTSIMTTTLIASTQILGNALGELLVGLVGFAAIIIILVPKILAVPRGGLVCKKCGYRNPPFVRSFCTGCGEALRSDKSTLRANKSLARAPQ